MFIPTGKDRAYIKGLVVGHHWYVQQISEGVQLDKPSYTGAYTAEWERGFKDGVEDARTCVLGETIHG